MFLDVFHRLYALPYHSSRPSHLLKLNSAVGTVYLERLGPLCYPDEIRDHQPPDAGTVLLRDGRNLASVLSLLGTQSPTAKAQVVELLSKVVPGVVDVTARHVGKKETLEFRQKVGENEAPWRIMAENMSDGTLRALGVLTALFQSSNGGTSKNRKSLSIPVPPGSCGMG